MPTEFPAEVVSACRAAFKAYAAPMSKESAKEFLEALAFSSGLGSLTVFRLDAEHVHAWFGSATPAELQASMKRLLTKAAPAADWVDTEGEEASSATDGADASNGPMYPAFYGEGWKGPDDASLLVPIVRVFAAACGKLAKEAVVELKSFDDAPRRHESHSASDTSTAAVLMGEVLSETLAAHGIGAASASSSGLQAKRLAARMDDEVATRCLSEVTRGSKGLNPVSLAEHRPSKEAVVLAAMTLGHGKKSGFASMPPFEAVPYTGARTRVRCKM